MKKILHSRGTGMGVGVLVVVVIGFLLVRKVSEYDVWFHLALGREILSNLSLPVADRFTLFSMGRPLHDSHWLFQVLLAAGYHVAGVWWLQAVQVGLWSLTFWFVYRATRVWTSPAGAWLLLLAVVIASEERFTIRPELVTVLMIAVFFWRLQQGKYRSFAEIMLLVGLQVVWTNSHGVFVIGPFLAGCYLVAALIEEMRGKGNAEARSLGILTGALAVSCLINPYGWRSFHYAWILFTEVGPAASPVMKGIYELQSPFNASSRSMIAFWSYLTLVTAFLITWMAVLLRRRQELSLAGTLVGFALLATSLTARHNLPLFALVSAPLIAEHLSLVGSSRLRLSCGAAVAAIVVVVGVVFPPGPAFTYARTWLPYRFGVGISSDYIPRELPAFLDRIGFSGPIFNSHSLGGFYEFYGLPGRIPFYDGRWEAFDQRELDKVFATIDHAYDQPAAWNDLVRQYDFRGVLLEHVSREAAGLLPLVSSDPGWRLVYLDHAASFWLRADQTQRAPAVNATTAAALVANASNSVQAENLDIFLKKTALYPELRLALLERTSQYWESPNVLKDLGLLQVQMGRLDQADRTFRQLLVLNPRARSTLGTLAQIALMRGDPDTAEMYLLQALHYYPDDPDLRENLARVRDVRR